AIEDDPTSPEVYQPYLDPEGDILLLEAFLNNDPLLPPPNQGNYLPEVQVELKDLPPHLEYAFLEGNNKLPVIITKDLSMEEKTALITVLKSYKRAITWKLSDIKGIDHELCTRKILMKEDFEPVVQHQRRVNLKIHDVIKQEVLKLLDAGLIYPISDSPWVSPVHCVPNKGELSLPFRKDAEEEFTFKLIDTKGAENMAADHLSRLENPHQNVLDPKEINESFPLETLNLVSTRGNSSTPWFADFANYHVGNFVVKGMSSQQKIKFFKDNKLSFPDLSPTCMTLELINRSISCPVGVAEDVYVKVEYSQEVLGFSDVIASGNPTPYYDLIFSTTSLTLTPFGNSDFLLEEVDAFIAIEDDPTSPEVYQPYIDPEGDILLLEAFLNNDPLLPPPNQGNYLPGVQVELKDLPPHLEYAFLESNNKFPVIITKDLSMEEKTALITVLKLHKRAITWKLSDIKGIDLELCTRKILMKEDFEPVVQHQRRVNLKIHDVIK
nr:reverse transcriptase domain-containing protein [Tanacetum cinerariifolium]